MLKLHKKIASLIIQTQLSVLAFVAINMGLTTQSFAQTQADPIDWWFDVEIIAFKRTGNDSQISEDFAKAMFDADMTDSIDLFTLAVMQQSNASQMRQLLDACMQSSTVAGSDKLVHLMPNLGVALPDVDLYESIINVIETDGTGESDESGATEPTTILTQETKPLPVSEIEICDSNLITADPMLYPSIEKRLSLPQTSGDLISALPVNIPGQVFEYATAHHVLPSTEYRMQEYATSLFKQRNVQPLLHSAWRQPVVFGEENAEFYRVIGGSKLTLPTPEKSYSELKEQFGTIESLIQDEVLNTDTFFEQLTRKLQDPQPIDWTALESIQTAQEDLVATKFQQSEEFWELDGRLKVYLNYVNGVPYLHVDQAFVMRDIDLAEDGSAQFKVYPMKQRRRIISKQIHYFDHPKLAIVVRLERHERPKIEDDNENIY